MLSAATHFADVPTPAFVYDEAAIVDRLELLAQTRECSGAGILYSIKALPFVGVLKLALPRVDGFSVSSLFEARLAAEVLARGGGRPGSLHITTPGFRAGEMDELAALCSHISFNSLEQFRRFQPDLAGQAEVGLRINPGLSFSEDPRYDPCRPLSKLGVPLPDLVDALARDPELAGRIHGLHFHTLFAARGAEPLRATLERVEAALVTCWPAGLSWINVGGGHVVEDEREAIELAGVLRGLRERRGVRVYLEPGNGVVGRAGFLVASVIDCFKRGGLTVAVLDTGVQHLPEVFEYQKPPALRGHRGDGRHRVLLAGSTCLAGDLFGEYRLDVMPKLGDKIVFEHVGAYSVVKASRFNGYDLPSVHALGADGRLRLVKTHGYEDYRHQWTEGLESLAGDTAGI